MLGIESSCDETAAAVVKNGRVVLSDVISSQIDIHKLFGGVVPEVASRNHTLKINEVVSEALANAGLKFTDIDAIAVTYGAGLQGALLVGVSSAKAYSYALDIPLIAVNHIQAHIAANFIAYPDLEPPFIAIVASGGHTSIIDVSGYNDYKSLGATVDDAIGEAFDKAARFMGLPYPGGPHIDALAKKGQPTIEFYKHKPTVNQDFSLSYSGLKTAVVNYIHNQKQKGIELNKEDISASLNKAAVDILVDTAIVAAKKHNRKNMVLAGGVAANSYLRSSLESVCTSNGITLYAPPLRLCTDNAVMVASRGYFAIKDGLELSDLTLNATSSLRPDSCLYKK